MDLYNAVVFHKMGPLDTQWTCLKRVEAIRMPHLTAWFAKHIPNTPSIAQPLVQ